MIFSPARRLAVRRRARALQRRPDAARYIVDDMVEDVVERLAFLRHQPRRALVIGDWTGALQRALPGDVTSCDPLEGFDETLPFPGDGYDLVVSLGTLDTLNDLPGGLIHIRNALVPGGLAIASFPGAGSLPALRDAMLAADGDRPSPRMHPMVDVRAGGLLLQRAGWGDPVIDSRSLAVRYSSLDSLVRDLRTQGLGNVLSRPGPALARNQYSIVKERFGRGTLDYFEILTLSGWRR